MKRILCGMLLCIAYSFTSKAQIGYQVSLLNTATGEPRANVTVNASVTITNSKGETIYSGTQSATSNDFGVLSLTVGNADTFKNVDFGKLPFFIQVSVDGRMIGRSQILNVPVAEAAKTLAPAISLDELCGKKWQAYYYPESDPKYYEASTFTFSQNGACVHIRHHETGEKQYNGTFEIEGKNIYAYIGEEMHHLRFHAGKLYMCSDR